MTIKECYCVFNFSSFDAMPISLVASETRRAGNSGRVVDRVADVYRRVFRRDARYPARADIPPSSMISVPVTQRASSEAR